MIIVSVDLHSAIDGRIQQLALMDICNDGRGTMKTGDYMGKTYVGRDAKSLGMRNRVSKAQRVNGFRRLDRHVWNLVAEMLYKMGYGDLHRLAKPEEAVKEDLVSGLARYLEMAPLTPEQVTVVAGALQIIEEQREGREL